MDSHTYKPQGALVEIFTSRDSEVLVCGSAGTGKTMACLQKVLFACLQTPNTRVLFVRKTAVSLRATALVTWREDVALAALAAGHVEYYGGSAAIAASYRFTNGSSITLAGLDEPTRILSSQFDLIYVQEAIELTESEWEILLTRLRNGKLSFQQLLADTNPAEPTHWLKKRVESGKTKLITSTHFDNPTISSPDGVLTERGVTYIAVLDSLTGVLRKRYRFGLWTSAEGMVYEGWDAARNVVDKFDPPEDWPRFWSVDFGYTNPMVVQFWAEDPDGRLYLYREFYRTQTLVEDAAREILDLVAPAVGDSGERVWSEPKPTKIICDHDAEGRATLERHLGLKTTAALKAVDEGIQAAQARVRPAGDGQPRLLVMRDALCHPPDQRLLDAKKPACLLDEIPGYVWIPDIAGKINKDAPVKINDHGCDAARYICADRDLGVPKRSKTTMRFYRQFGGG